MRPAFLFCVLAFCTANISKAQGPTITSAEVPVPGDILSYANTKIAGVAIPATGANITWDYSGLIDSGGYEIDTFLAPSATPYAAVFPAANLAFSDGTNTFGYYLNNTSNWSSLGFLNAVGDTGYYSKPFSVVHFPFSYGSTFTDSADFVLKGPASSDTLRQINLQHATGYGTLKVPGKTYTNVLAINSQTQFGSASLTNTSIRFATPGAHSFVMQIDLGPQNELTGIIYRKTGIVVVTAYTFNGNGNWNNSANWSGNTVPPSTILSGIHITISPQPGEACILNVPVNFSPGAVLTVATGAVFDIQGNLTINH